MAFLRNGAEIVDDFALVPDMVAGGKDVGAEVEKVLGDGWRQSESAGGIFRIHDYEIHLAFLDQVRQVLPHNPSPRTAENVPDKEQFHRESYLS
jgi:hypothetical protein